MKTVAIVDEGSASGADCRDYLERIRRTTAADDVLVIVNGDFSRDGSLAARDKYDRTATLLASGASGVVEMPVCGVLLGDNQYAFAVSVMLRKLGCVDEVVLPYEGADEPMFLRTAEFLFDEPAAYQRRMRALRDQGADLDAVLPETVGAFVDGAEEFLRKPMNRMAVEYHNILRKSYSSVRPRLMRVGGAPAAEELDAARDRYLMEQVALRFQGDGRSAIEWAANQFSGSEKAARRVLQALAQGSDGGFRAFSERVAWADMNAVTVRRYLLGCLIGYRKVDSFVCITYNYVPYIRILGLAGDRRFRERLLGSAETTALMDAMAEKDFSQLQEDCKRLLSDLDARARGIYEKSVSHR